MNNPDIRGLVDEGLLDLDRVFGFGWADAGRPRPEWTLGDKVGQLTTCTDDKTATVCTQSATAFGITVYRWCIVWSDGQEHDECGECRLSLDEAKRDGERVVERHNRR